jgi:hypothetical protein
MVGTSQIGMHMAFTDNCDLFASIHEDGVNRILQHMMLQRPSLFNYGTSTVASNKGKWCEPVNFTSDVTKYRNPIFKVVNPIPVMGADLPPVGLDFCAQITYAKIDFHPGDSINLPDELNPPLQKQYFSLKFTICATIDCPSDDVLRGIQPNIDESQKHQIIVPGKPNCFCLDVFVIGHFQIDVSRPMTISGWVDSVDIVDIKPDTLEDNVACYLKTTIDVLFREKFFILLSSLTFSFPLFTLANIRLCPTPTPITVPLNLCPVPPFPPTLPIPNNPAVEDDRLKAFITMTVV